MIKNIKFIKDSGGAHILNAILHGKQKKAGKYYLPHDTDAAILVKAETNWAREALPEENKAAETQNPLETPETQDPLETQETFGVSEEDTTRRWSPFIHFERVVQGQRAMHGGENLILDVLPGRHSIEAIINLSDLPSLKGANLNDVPGVRVHVHNI